MLAMPERWPRSRGLFVAVAAMGVLASIATLDRPAPQPDRGSAPGARVVTMRTSDGVTLNARLWSRDPRRIVVYLHEYGDEQSTWWPTAEAGDPGDPSALTFDFRGHGASDGSAEDVDATPEDVRAALAFVADEGYQQVVLAGAGMGAAAAMDAAAGWPQVRVLGISAPGEFAGMRPVEIVPALQDRVAFIASEGDLSARLSIAAFRERAAVPASRIVMLKGGDHGEALFTGDHRREATAAFRRLLAELWQP
ncbi:MAG: alpha/beta fold hydrolase [Dehalococcoidia bacterium]